MRAKLLIDVHMGESPHKGLSFEPCFTFHAEREYEVVKVYKPTREDLPQQVILSNGNDVMNVSIRFVEFIPETLH